MKKVLTIVLFFLFPIFLFAQQSYNMSLLGRLTYDVRANDVWGYVDGQGTEYAIVGLVNGTSFVDVSDPENPIEKAFIPGPTCVWRDIKTWQHYAYVVHDGVDYSQSQGLTIVDLSDLANGAIDYSHFYYDSQFNNAHNIYIDEKGSVYLFGGNYASGGALMFDIRKDPENPVYLGVFDDYYLHDGMVRGDTLWGSAIWEGVLAAIDVSDKSNPVILGSVDTPNRFTHNSWVSDDGNYVFTTDEVPGADIAAIDVSNVNDMTVIDQIQSWSPQTNVIPHNTHVKGKYLVTSYYCDGVTVVDASDPYHLQEVAYYDTSDSTGGTYSGAWGVYPWLPSDNILVTDRQEGLHILSVDHLDFSVKNLDSFLAIDIYPNPTADYFQLQFESIDWTVIQVADVNGKLIEKVENTTKTDRIQIGKSWGFGAYLLSIEDAMGLSIHYLLVKSN